MGTFEGHFLPGSFFIIFSVWWISQITVRAVICKRKNIRFYNTSSYPWLHGRLANIPLEGIAKICMTSIGITVELLASTRFGKAGKIVYLGDVQHATMYFFFLISGVVDILVYKGKMNFVKGLDYVVAALAFTIEAMLFNFHLHGRPGLDTMIHQLLLYVLAATVIACLVEMYATHSMLAGYVRSYLVLLQGTWFIQVGFILYNPIHGSIHWDENDHDSMLLASLIFAWHAGAVMVAVGLIALVTRQCLIHACPLSRGDVGYDAIGNHLAMERFHQSSDGNVEIDLSEQENQTKVGDASDSDEELFATSTDRLLKS